MKLICKFLLFFFALNSFGQSRSLRLTLQSHNEMNDPINYNDLNNWTNVKAKIAMLVDTIVHYQVRYNLQCESNFILANITRDNAYNLSTDLLQTMEEHSLIEVDPHNHLNKDPSSGFSFNPYNYADLAHLLDSCGISRITTVGGYLFNSTEWTYSADEDWRNYGSGISGNYFNTSWTPELLWGGGTMNHANDPFSLGVWRPKGADYILFPTHDASHLPNIGNGCDWVIQNTTNIDSLVTALQRHTDYFTNHIPSDPDMFLCGTVIFNFRYILTPGYIEKICEFIRKVNPMVQDGRIIWQNLYEGKYQDWMAAHSSSADNYLLFCSDLPANLGIEEDNLAEGLVYPNPTQGIFHIQLNIPSTVTIFDADGRELIKRDLNGGLQTIQLSLKSGIYFVKVTSADNESIQRLIVD